MTRTGSRGHRNSHSGFFCVFCKIGKTKVVRTVTKNGFVNRTRKCSACSKNFQTVELHLDKQTDDFLLFVNNQVVADLIQQILKAIGRDEKLVNKLTAQILETRDARLSKILG